MRTAITERLGIDIPLVAFSHCRDVVAAVSKAGGLGMLGAIGYSPAALDAELDHLDAECGGHRYGVDVLIPRQDSTGSGGPGATIPAGHHAFVDELLRAHGLPPAKRFGTGGLRARMTPAGATELIDVALSHPVALVASALGPPPAELVRRAHQRDVPVAALVGTVQHADRQLAAGVDIIVAQGGEAGGHTGEISTMVLVPEVADAVAPTPVLAAGGIACGRQLAAALALGAAGAWTGSVWLTTTEAETPAAVKRKLLAAGADDTVRSRCRTGKPARQLASAWTDAWEGPDSPGALPMPQQLVLAEEAMATIIAASDAGAAGATELANYFVGQCVGRLTTVRPAREVVYRMVEEFADTLLRLDQISGR